MYAFVMSCTDTNMDGGIVDGDTSHHDDNDAATAATTDTLANYASTVHRSNSTGADENDDDDKEKGNNNNKNKNKKQRPGGPKNDQQAAARNSNSKEEDADEEEQSSSKPASSAGASFSTHTISTKQLWCGDDDDNDDDDDDDNDDTNDDDSDDIILILNTRQDYDAKIKMDDDGAVATATTDSNRSNGTMVESTPAAATATKFEDANTKQAEGGPDGRNDSNLRKHLNQSQSRTTSLSESQSRTSTASSGIPGAYRMAPSSTRSSSIEIEANESSDFSNTAETNENSGITTAETADVDADVEAAVAAAGGAGAATENHPVSTAYLVQDELAEVVEMKPFYKRKEGRRTITLVTFLLVAMAILLGVLLTLARRRKQDAELNEQLVPSMSPSQAPSFDPRPTLQVVQDRGVVKCGIEDVAEGDEKFGKYQMDFCRGLAAVLFGDPARVSPVSVGDDRYEKLLGRQVDVLFAGDTFTLEKAIKEVRTNIIIYIYIYESGFS